MVLFGVRPSIILHLFSGTFPITASIYSLLHILAKHPQIQEKMYEELNRVVGKNRLRLMDESSLPFCSAVILELGRHSPALPLGMRYRTVQEEVIMDNFFPKHTSVSLINLFESRQSLFSIFLDKDIHSVSQAIN